MISTKQRLEFGRSVVSRFSIILILSSLQRAFGQRGIGYPGTEEFSCVLREALKSLHTPVVIAIDIDADRNELLFRSDRFRE